MFFVLRKKCFLFELQIIFYAFATLLESVQQKNGSHQISAGHTNSAFIIRTTQAILFELNFHLKLSTNVWNA